MYSTLRKSLAELVGTYILVLFGPGSVVASVAVFHQPLDPLTVLFIGISFAIGIAIAIMTVGPISGAHINPAVTLALFVSGKFKGKEVVPYILAQLAGALLASATTAALFGYSVSESVKFGATIPGYRGPAIAFLAELIMTFFLLWTILGLTGHDFSLGAIGAGVGAYVAAEIFIIIKISGGSINPARSFGPAVLSGILLNSHYYQWIYWVAPIIGGILGALSYKYLFLTKSSEKT